jgi:hypothetical protein
MIEYIEIAFRVFPFLLLLVFVFLAARAKDDLRAIIWLLWAVLVAVAAIADKVAA